MRVRVPFIAFAALLAPVTAMTLISACGSTETIVDAGPDVTTKDQVAADVAPDVIPEAGCSNDAQINLDAAFDAGGFTTCVSCFQSKCGSQVSACNADCQCRQSVVDALTCIAQGGSFATCGQAALLGGDMNVTNLFGCAYTNCIKICTGDGGVTGDSGVSDAAGDGG